MTHDTITDEQIAADLAFLEWSNTDLERHRQCALKYIRALQSARRQLADTQALLHAASRCCNSTTAGFSSAITVRCEQERDGEFERCCKLLCSDCQEGHRLAQDSGGRWIHPYPNIPGSIVDRHCFASVLRKGTPDEL